MKIKATPSDFIVKEILDLKIQAKPCAFKVYRLQKKEWETFDLLRLVSRRLNIAASEISLAGMKDRHGDTDQLVSVPNAAGLPASITEKNFSLVEAGYSDHKLSAADMKGNQFTIVIRAIPRVFESLFLANIREAAAWGFPNYYDEQRFGSARHGEGFVGKELFLGNMEQACRLFFLPSRHDRKDEKKFKQQASAHWGKWKDALALAPAKYREIVSFLAQPGCGRSYTRALNLIERRVLIMMLCGYQSFLFNKIAGAYIALKAAEHGFALSHHPYKYGRLSFFREIPGPVLESLNAVFLPVPGHDTRTDDPFISRILDKVLGEEGIGLDDLKVKRLRRCAVKGIERKLIVRPENLKILESCGDDLYPGKSKIRLEFFLPRGCYATILVKRAALGSY